MKRLTLPEGKELCDFLNEEGIAPCDLEEGNPRSDAVEIEGFVMSLEMHPADNMLNAYQMFRKVEDEDTHLPERPSALWECDEWI